MKTLLERFNEKASKAECVTAEAAMKAGFVELIQSVLESFIGAKDPKDLEAAIRAASTKLSERIVDNALAPKAPADFDVETVRDAAKLSERMVANATADFDAKTVREITDAAITAAIDKVKYESTENDYKTERFAWYKVTSAGIINSFDYADELLAGIKVGKALRLWAKCDHGAYALYMGALNADDDDAFVDSIKKQVKDGTIPEPLGRVIFIADILRKKIDDMKDKAVAAAEAKATQNPPKKKVDTVKAEEKETATVAEEAAAAQA